MTAYKTILVPLDGSTMAEQVLPEVKKIASSDSTLHLLQVVPTENVPYFPFTNPDKFHQELKKEAESYMQEVEERLQRQGYTVDAVVRSGNPAEQIVNYASELNADIIAMTTLGAGGLAHWLLGSVAEKVVRHATTPVLLIHATQESVADRA